MNRQTIFGQAVFAILRKIKREATPTHKPMQVASHFILPQRTQDSCMTRILIGNPIFETNIF